jgi:pyrroline-5-carboxylate reductase
MSNKPERLCVIGSGNMGEALIKAMAPSGIYNKKDITVTDINQQRLDYFIRNYHIKTHQENTAGIKDAQTVILAVKPQILSAVLTEIKGKLEPESLIISIAAGRTIKSIEDVLGSQVHIVRVMPNTPALVNEGVCAICAGSSASSDDIRKTKQILSSIGKTFELEEEYFDAVTALSGSGPAYVFYLAEAMVQSGKEMGLSANIADMLTMQTIKGSAALLEQSSENAEELRNKVTSKGGTTEAAINMMKDLGVGKNIIKAIKAAKQRSIELSG